MTTVQLGCGILKMVGPKKQDFCPRINILTGFFLQKKSVDDLRFVKKCQGRTFKVNFQSQKSTKFFQKKISSKNINLGDHFSLKTFFSKLNIWTTLLTKITPNFWLTDIPRRNFLEHFPWWYVDSWPKILLFRTHHP